jgi:bifunctional NMN adenylyltransferase/nudix hydrolase
MESQQRPELAVVIGRFQPFHLGHLALVKHALNVAPRVAVVLGSARGPRFVKNPFTAEERSATIRASLSAAENARVEIVTIRDYFDEPRWAAAVKAAIAKLALGPVSLVGFVKDDSSAYLGWFPEWRAEAVPRQAPIDATPLRRLYFTSGDQPLPAELTSAVPAPVADFLLEFRGTPHFARLAEELGSLDETRQKYGPGPFITVDALVTQDEHLLLIQRGRPPGRGLWALPGGFLDGDERLLAAAIRELREETEIALSDAELRAALKGVQVFDHPQRSQRGRTITHAHYFALPARAAAQPRVQGADDAQAAQWLPVARVAGMTDELFDDHYQIIDYFLKVSRD